MRTKIIFIILLILLNLSMLSGIASAYEYDYFRLALLTVGKTEVQIGKQKDIIDVSPYVKNGRTLVPLRFMENALGAKLSWDKVTQTAILEFKGKQLIVSIGKSEAYVNGEKVTLDVSPEINKGRTFVPLRFISENLGARVRYYPEDQNIIITYIDTDGWNEFQDKSSKLLFKYPTNFKVLKKDSELKLETPHGTIVNIKSEARDINDVLNEKRIGFSKDGWEIMFDKETSAHSPYKGVTIGAFNQSEEIIYDSFFFLANNVTCSWEAMGQNSWDDFIYDDFLTEEIFLSAQVQK